MSVTIYDIAAEAEVSIATVSRVLNGSPRVAKATRARVHRVAERMGYQPHALAQSLARQTTGLVSAVIPVLTNDFYMEVLRGIQDAVAQSDFDLLVYAAADPEHVDGQLARALQRGRAEGVLLLSTPVDAARRELLNGSTVVLLDVADAAFDSFTVDNSLGGYLATHHLLENGFQRIAHISVVPEPLPARERRAGYERALAEAGRTPLIAASDQRPYGFSEAAGYEAMTALLALPERPDAVFIASDAQALGALSALREAGLSAPHDMAVVGFDDIKVAEVVGLSTVRQPMHEMGRLAVERLVARLADSQAPPIQHVFSPTLVVRASSARRV